MKVLCVCLSATIQRTLCFDSFFVEQVNRTQHWREDASGKALNTARVLNQLEPGIATALCPVGTENSERFMNLVVSDANLSVHPFYVAGNTRECWTVLDAKRQTTTELVADEIDKHHLAGAEAELELLSCVKEYMQTCDVLLFAGSRPAKWSVNLCARICTIAMQAGKLVVADFRGVELQETLKICTPHIIKINEDEFCQTFGGLLLSEEELTKAIQQKSKELSAIVIVTRGKKDVIAADSGTLHRYPVETVDIVNTTACGDSFSAGLIYEYLSHKNIDAAIKKGIWCASRNAEHVVPGAID